jgi:general secretion pathway protein B
MSFILDALKKSENDRQRQNGPALFEVRVAPPRTRLPTWAVALGALLLVNLGVVGWLLLKRPAVAAATSPQTSAPSATPTAPAVPPPAYAQPMPVPQPQQYAAVPQYYAPPQQPGGMPVQPQALPPGAYMQPQPNPYQQPAWPQPALPNEGSQLRAAPYGGGTAGTFGAPSYAEPQAMESYNPDDYAPAIEPPRPPASEGPVYARRGTESGLPTYDEASTRVNLPDLRMDLHVYSPDPTKRFVLMNMKRLNEGDATPEGVKLESITVDGAILSYKGSRFVMLRE